jgi:uncharacterized protein YdaU (DUF1376 family)
MGKAPAFQFYASDFLTDTMDWSDEQVGVHIRLLAWSWVNRRGIPRDTQRLTRIAPGVVSAWPVIGPKWIEGPDETWLNEKLESTRSNSDAFRASQRERSLLAVEARSKKKSRNGKPKGKPMGSPMGDPLEDEVEDTLSSGKKERAHELTWPRWAGENTRAKWEEFKAYRSKLDGFRYKTEASEQAAINTMARYYDNGKDMVAGIEMTMAKGWKFPVDPKELAPKQANGKPVPMTRSEAHAKLEDYRAANGIAPGGVVETHMIPADIYAALK